MADSQLVTNNQRFSAKPPELISATLDDMKPQPEAVDPARLVELSLQAMRIGISRFGNFVFGVAEFGDTGTGLWRVPLSERNSYGLLADRSQVERHDTDK